MDIGFHGCSWILTVGIQSLQVDLSMGVFLDPHCRYTEPTSGSFHGVFLDPHCRYTEPTSGSFHGGVLGSSL